ncbi:MAG: Holliday junction branch migration protein RuvA [Pelagibacteraceae bacterium TMED237]|nr:Holliday junction branch migration protein RuvA [Candidatus Neomarinimicrobiota bacterium]OUW96615.1 MAG: Holliday junction branch migration protein RuvA [Pelagibacteraceae bacterium TMED237]|tara:strand:+ start:2594 stop:3172 length:579 start_codon:yes stop_codon:yes gene_type:complete
MIVFLQGKLVDKLSDKIVVGVNGLGYECNISGYTFEKLPDKGEDVFLYTYLSISENNHSLFGFLNIEERRLFKLLISINGIGPKTAIPILSSAKPEDIINRISSGDSKMLSSLPGIGPKTAQRIIVELKDKLPDGSYSLKTTDSSIVKDALSALSILGYSGALVRKRIDQILIKNENIKTADLIKETLNKIK